MVFNIAEGLSGRSREAQVPAILELYGLPYTFSDPLVCAATLDKAVAKRLVRSAGVATAGFRLFRDAAELDGADPGLGWPVFAKPVAEGTGKGVDSAGKIDSPERLREVCLALMERFAQPVLVEEYLPGGEFTTAVVGNGEKARVLGTMEISIRPAAGTRDYSYRVKELCEELVEYVPAPRDDLRLRVERIAMASYRALECRDVGRVDVRCDAAGEPVFIELNPLPGMHPKHSDLPMIATQEGMSYPQLIDAILRCAFERVEAGNV